MCLHVVSESNPDKDTNCCGGFSKPKVEGTEEKECRSNCGCVIGRGDGPVKEGSVQETSGLLQTEVGFSASIFCRVVAPEGEFIVDIMYPLQTSYFKESIAPLLLQAIKPEFHLFFPSEGIWVSARKISDCFKNHLREHYITFRYAKIFPWTPLSHFILDVVEGVV